MTTPIFSLYMQLYCASHKKDDRVMLGPRMVLRMKELTKEDSWMKIVDVLQGLGYEEDFRRTHAVLQKEYFKVHWDITKTYYELLLRKETLASRLEERKHPLQESVRGFYMLEKCRFSDE